MSKARAWVNVLRLSNTPTLISNVMVGFGLGIAAHRLQWSDATIVPTFSPLVPLFLVTLALLCAYFAGLVLNDAIDVEFDKKNRPDRPLPSGTISKTQVWIVGFSLLVAALVLSTFTQILALYFMAALLCSVLIYTYLHRFMIPALIFMGLCRGMVYVVAFSAFNVTFQSEPLFVFSLGIAWYTAVLTFIARGESKNNTAKRWLALLLLPAAYVPAIMYFTQFQFIWIVLSLGLFTIWTVFTIVVFHLSEKSVHGIHMMLVGFCLLDVVYLCVAAEVPIAIVSGLCAILTIIAQRKVLGT